MRIAIEATMAQRSPSGGMGQYVCKLLQGLAALAGNRHEFLLFHSERDWTGPDFGTNFRPVSYFFHKQSLATLFRLNHMLKKHRADIFHATCTLGAPPHARIPVVSTIHDLYPLIHPEGCTRTQAFFFRQLLKWTLDSSSYYITNSKVTSAEIARYAKPGMEGRIKHIYLGPSFAEDVYRQSSELERCGRYILIVGGVEKRKGQLFLLDAYLRALEKDASLPDLVFIGHDRGTGRELEERISRAGVGDRVRWFKRVNEAELIGYYRNAFAFAFPSFYEGFGIPLLDAMKFKLPVLCGDIPVLREIGGNYPMFLSHDVDLWSKAIVEFSSGLLQHQFVLQSAEKILDTYSWERCALETLECYELFIKNAARS